FFDDVSYLLRPSQSESRIKTHTRKKVIARLRLFLWPLYQVRQCPLKVHPAHGGAFKCLELAWRELICVETCYVMDEFLGSRFEARPRFAVCMVPELGQCLRQATGWETYAKTDAQLIVHNHVPLLIQIAGALKGASREESRRLRHVIPHGEHSLQVK